MPNAILLYRVAHWLYHKRVPFLPILIQGLIFLLYNSKLPYRNEIGKDTKCICKGIGVSLVEGTEIGERCRIGIHAVFVGKGPYKQLPRVGNDVWIGPGAVIMGPVIVGNNSIISANSVVNKSVPDGAIVAGIPAKIIGWVKDLEYDILKNESYNDKIMPFLQESQA
jgi:serine O-acetyltransferase